MGVIEGPDIEQDISSSGSGSGRGNGGKRNGRKRRNQSDAAARAVADREVTTRPQRDRNGHTARNKTLRQLLEGSRAIDSGDFRARLTPNGDPLMAEVVEVFNSVASRHERLSEEVRRVSFSVGREGNMRERVQFPASGSWNVIVDAVNNLITDLVSRRPKYLE